MTSTASQTGTAALKPLHNVNHFAFRCRDAEQTRWFYEDVLGLKLAIAFEEVKDFGENLGRPRTFMHLFFEMGDGNYLAFFDEPDVSTPAHFERKDSFDVHVALEAENYQALLNWQARINAMGKSCLGPIDHGFVHSVYMYDPNGLQVEITCRAEGYPAIAEQKRSIARTELDAFVAKTRARKLEVFGQKALDQRGRPQ
jgi:catechol 2,3-dioxygenase-like lactoylglutathione lyase family enzyme